MNSKNRVALGLAALGLMAGLSACGGGTDTVIVGGGTIPGDAWFDVYGNGCATATEGPRPGCDFYADGVKIDASEDPYYYNYPNGDGTGGYNLYYATWGYTDVYGYHQYYTGYAWLSPDNVLYDQYGNALNEVGSDQAGHDLIGDAAQKEASAITSAAEVLKGYGMAEENAQSFAQTLNDFATLPKTRARTVADLDATIQKMYGFDLNTGKEALTKAVQGDLSAITSLNTVVANHLGMTPEASEKMLRKFYGKRAARMGYDLSSISLSK